ncbi:MAG: hypothetical protein NZ693_04065, partial [Thermoflexales bacterium]|nr:hypothetical protein [Thermoflexales bacterium]
MQRLRRLIVSAALLLSACTSGSASSSLTPLPYTDEFDDPSSGWETLSDLSAEVRYDRSALRILVKQENLAQWSFAGKQFADGVLEVEARALGGPLDNGFGVIFRAEDAKNFYHFAISSDGYWRAGIVKEGEWTYWNDWQPHPAVKSGAERNQLRVVMQSARFDLYINGQLVSSQEDDSFQTGDIGVFALSLIGGPGV